jgi:thioredoxin 1
MAQITQVNQFEFHHLLETIPGPALVLFTGPDCGACRQLKAQLAGETGILDGVSVFEVDAERDMALMREFEVFHLPALFLFSDGQFHCELHSEPSPLRIREAIDAALKRPAQEAP